MPSQAMASCESEKQLEKLVSSHLHKVMLSDTLARKVILLSSCSHVGVRSPIRLCDSFLSLQ